jgi:predicted metal-dependent phosphoesterase TrpH
MKPMISIDFHCHTSVSKDSFTSPEQIIAAAHRKGLDRLVVADHNTIDGALAAHALDPELIIVGEEIKTAHGEILAAFVSESIPRDLSPQETIHRLRQQGAFISVSHPFDSWRSGAWKVEDLLEIVPLVDAIEVFNARCLRKEENRLAMDFARQHDLPGTAGSDAHLPREIGAARLALPQFEGPEELRAVIRQGEVYGRLSPFWVHFRSSQISWKKSRLLEGK